MKLFLLFFVLLNITHTVSMAQKPVQIKHLDGTKMSAEKLTDGIKKIADEANITGLSVVVINDNRVVYEDFFGVKNRETGEKLGKETVMYAASLTKPLFAFAFLQLAEKKVFDLDKPVYTYLKKPIGEYERWKDLAGEKDFEKITARMILSHSAGLPVLRQLYNNKVTIIAPPAAKFYYSNEGFNLLGFIVEEHTGQKLENIVKETVFDPLKMNRSGMIWREEFNNDFAMGHDAQEKVIGAQKRTSSRAAGSMVTTAGDYSRFIIALLSRQKLSKPVFEQMLKPQISVASEKSFGPARDKFTGKYQNINLSWGIGFGLFQTSYGKVFFHGGHTEGWQNYFAAYPEKKTAVILMSNSDNFEPVADKILKLTIADTQSPLEWLGYFDKKD